MTLRIQQVPNPPVGQDWSTVVPGEYLWDVVSVVATLTTAPGCASFNPNAAMDSGSSIGGSFSGRVDLPAAAFNPGNGPLSIELWIRSTSATPVTGTFAASQVAAQPAFTNAIFFFPRVANVIQFGLGQPGGFFTAIPSTVPDPTRWTHYVATSTGPGGTFAIYENGALIQTGATGVYNVGPTVASQIAGANFAGVQTFTSGVIDEVAYYHAALSPARVAAHYAAMCVGFSTYAAAVLSDTPVSYYHLDEPVGATTVNDASGNTHSGVVADNPVFGAPGAAEGATPRYPSLQVTDGSSVVMVAPSITGQPNGETDIYTWYQANSSSIPTPGVGRVSVAISRLVLPAGYVVESVTGNLDPGDQWSGIAVLWDDTLMRGLDALPPFDFHSILLVPPK